ncbi:MAG: hypothetical protein WC509_03405 [Candidatus Izemoplasmatales bacterium]
MAKKSKYAWRSRSDVADQYEFAKISAEICELKRMKETSPIEKIELAVKEEYHRARMSKLSGNPDYRSVSNKQLYQVANNVVRRNPNLYL